MIPAHAPAFPRDDIPGAYRHCEQLTRSHYENFPVASLFLPKEKRPFLWSIYAFARTADDFADEGTLSAGERLRRLDEWEARLDGCVAGDADDPVFIALGDTLRKTGVPRELLTDLLTAFRMDVTMNRYRTFQDLLGYCRYSANPVGRLVLHLFDNATPRTITLSDTVCTALQLANFWQDVRVDWAKDASTCRLKIACDLGIMPTISAGAARTTHSACFCSSRWTGPAPCSGKAGHCWKRLHGRSNSSWRSRGMAACESYARSETRTMMCSPGGRHSA